MSTITADAFRDQMAKLLQAGDGYGYLARAVPYLDASPADHYTRLMAVQEFLKLGIVKPARELVDACASIPGVPAEFSALGVQIREIPDGIASWDDFTPTFESNLAALAEKGVDADTIRAAWSAGKADYELYIDRKGHKQVRARDEKGRWRWVPFLGNHAEAVEAHALPDDIGGMMPGPYLFEGIGVGGIFERIFDKTLDTFHGFSCALYIIETDPAALGPALHLRDWRGVLADPRVFVFLGESAGRQLCDVLDRDVNLPWPQRVLKIGPAREEPPSDSLKCVQEGAARRMRVIDASAHDLEARYRSRDLAYWAQRLDEALSGKGEPLRILAAVSIHTTFLKYSMRDVKHAAESLGHTFVVLSEEMNHQIIGPLSYLTAIRELDPDLFFILDHVRPEFGSLIPENLPVLTWDQDCLPDVFTKKNLDRVARHDFIVGCSKPRFIQLGYDPAQYLNTVIPTSPRQFSGEALSDEESARYSCDVSYVSHASQTAEAFHKEELAGCSSPKVAELLSVLYELMHDALKEHGVARTGLGIELIERASQRCGIKITDVGMRNWLAEWYLWRLGDRLFRHEALEWVADWAKTTGRSFRIYGNGWAEHPTLAEFAVGPAMNGRELICVHRASKINLQLMPAGFLHQRAMDGLASGGFFLARRVAAGTGKTLRALLARAELSGVNTSDELINSKDPELQDLLRGYLGEWAHRMQEHSQDLLAYLRACAEIDHPEEVFPRLGEIEFDSASSFAVAAERFLADDELRRSITEEMRDVVVKRFSYEPTLQRFLNGMASYLRQASNTGVAQFTA